MTAEEISPCLHQIVRATFLMIALVADPTANDAKGAAIADPRVLGTFSVVLPGTRRKQERAKFAGDFVLVAARLSSQ